MTTLSLTKHSTLGLTVLGLSVLAALVVLVPGEAEAGLVVRAEVGPVKVVVNTPTVVRCGLVTETGLVLRSVGGRGHGRECRGIQARTFKPGPKHAVWIAGHFEIRRYQGKVWIPGHWAACSQPESCGYLEKPGRGRLHR